MAYLILKMNIY